MRILVIGASGQLAQSLAELDTSEPGLTIVARGRPAADLSDPATIAAAIDQVRPDVVVNAAGYTAVDAAENDSERAFALNAAGAGALAAATAARRLPLIHVSTDYVFSGSGGRPYREDDATEPRTAYGRSKLAGEAAVAAANPDHAILRTAWLYSRHGGNFVRTMLQRAESGDRINVVDDQAGNPTYASDLAQAILVVAERMRDAPGDPRLRGVFHVAGPDSASWCDFAREILRLSKVLGGPFASVMPIASSDYKTAADRPRDSRLDSTKVRETFGIALPRRVVSLPKCMRAILRTQAAGD
jgi:dTDP-4-dehydrorhamnose reductase